MRKFLLIAAAIFFYIAGCTKIESTTIGTGLIPPVDGVTTFDTLLDVYTNSFLDSLGPNSKVYLGDDHMIGLIDNDPVFGKTTATTYLELKPTYYKYDFPGDTSLSFDSAVLILSYKGHFGDASVPQEWEVYELTDPLKNDSVYTVSSTFDVGTTPVGSKIIHIDSLGDSVRYGFELAKNQIRIKLSDAFAQKLIKTFESQTVNGAYVNDSLFRDHFKGLAIMPKAGSMGKALVRVNLLDTNTKLALFYNYRQGDTAAARTHEVSYFRFSQTTPISGHANNIVRQYNGSALLNNSSVNDAEVFIQTTPGTFATIKIPQLASFPNAIIHRAELLAIQLPDAGMLYQKYTAPDFLLLSRYDSVNKIKRNIPNDFTVSSGVDNFYSFGGYTIDRAVNGVIVKSYNFDISRYVQGIVTRKDTSFTLRLSSPTNDSLSFTSPYPSNIQAGLYYIIPSISNQIANGRVVLGGGGRTFADPYRMRLRIVYSKI